MFIEKRKRGKNVKYYLVHSFREDAKVRKIRRFLGSNLSQKELNEKRKHAENFIREQIRIYKAIRDPLKTVLSDKELRKLEDIEDKGKINIQHLSEMDWKAFMEDFVYNTNAIEGSTVEQAEVRKILRRDEWPAGKTRGEISETYGVAEAIKYIRRTKTHVSLELIKKLHFIIFRNSKPFAGELRKKGQEVAVTDNLGRVLHKGAPSSKVPELLRELVSWYNNNKKRYPPITLAGVVHDQFENIHPFLDGNGRVGRLLLSNVLLKHSLPPVNIHFSSRRAYYSSLQEYQKFGNIRPTIELILKEYRKLRKSLGKR